MGIPSTLVPVGTAEAPWCAWIHIEVRARLIPFYISPSSRKWQPTPVFLPGKFHGQKNLEGYSTWGYKESSDLGIGAKD